MGRGRAWLLGCRAVSRCPRQPCPPGAGHRQAGRGSERGSRRPRFPLSVSQSPQLPGRDAPSSAARLGGWGGGAGLRAPPLHLSHGRSATKTTASAEAGTSGKGTRGPCCSPHPMEEGFLESFGRLSLQQPQPRPPAPPPPRGTPPRRHSFRKRLYLLRGLPGSGKTTLAR